MTRPAARAIIICGGMARISRCSPIEPSGAIEPSLRFDVVRQPVATYAASGRYWMRVAFYGRLAEAIGREVEIDLPAPAAVAVVQRRLAELYPGSGVDASRVRTAVGGMIVDGDRLVQPGETVEILAPLSGG